MIITIIPLPPSHDELQSPVRITWRWLTRTTITQPPRDQHQNLAETEWVGAEGRGEIKCLGGGGGEEEYDNNNKEGEEERLVPSEEE